MFYHSVILKGNVELASIGNIMVVHVAKLSPII